MNYNKKIQKFKPTRQSKIRMAFSWTCPVPWLCASRRRRGRRVREPENSYISYQPNFLRSGPKNHYKTAINLHHPVISAWFQWVPRNHDSSRRHVVYRVYGHDTGLPVSIYLGLPVPPLCNKTCCQCRACWMSTAPAPDFDRHPEIKSTTGEVLQSLFLSNQVKK